VGGLSPESSNIAITGVCLRCRSSLLLKHCWVVHASTSHTVTQLWRWPSFTILHLVVATPVAASVYFSDTGWSEHDGPAVDHWFSHTKRAAGLSYLLSAIFLPHRQPWNLKPCTVSHRATSERLSQYWCNHERCTLARLEAFLYVRNCKIINVCGRDRWYKIADADEMRTQNSIVGRHAHT